MRYFALALILTASLSAQDDGAKAFASRCGACHGADGGGGERGPRILTDRGDLAKLVREGVNAMPALELSPSEMTAVAEFVKDLISSRKNDRPAEVFPKLNGPSRDWSTYHGQFSGNRDSPLKLINTGNIASLGSALDIQHTHSGPPRKHADSDRRRDVRDSRERSLCSRCAQRPSALALPAATQQRARRRRGWRHQSRRGDLWIRLFLVTDNAHLIALDRVTGHLLWDIRDGGFPRALRLYLGAAGGQGSGGHRRIRRR